MNTMRNALTVDVEDWYMTSGLDIPPEQWHCYEDRVVRNTMELLELFDRFLVKATFFILGCVAEKHPELVEEISKRGHEIGSHGGWHRLVTSQSLEQFREDLRYSKELLERISGSKVVFYRAPSWSIAPCRFSVLKILEEEGFHCDSSMQPFRTPLSGIAGAPCIPFQPNLDGQRIDIIEFPPTVTKLAGITVPFAGGFYLRAIPYRFIRSALKRVNRNMPGMIYVHPWELDPGQPRIQAKPLIRFIQYYGLSETRAKLEQLLSEFSFGPLGSIIQGNRYPQIRIYSSGAAKGSE